MIMSRLSSKKLAATRIATASARPRPESAVRTGQRMKLRKIIIMGWERRSAARPRSRIVRRKFGGAGGAMATAGGRRAARIAACAAPRAAVARPRRAAIR